MTRVPPAWRFPLLLITLAVIFLVFPEIDLAVSRLFYVPGRGFPWSEAAWVKAIYAVAPWLLNGLAVASALALLLSLWPRYRHWLRPAAYVMAVVLGVQLIGGELLKDEWGRARPHQIREFGGSATFTPAWLLSDQCQRNCSFVSGHASGAFAWMALAWVFPRRRRLWLALGLAWGSMVSLVRLMQGGHFLSDVVFAGLLVYLIADLLARLILHRPRVA